MGDDHLTSAAEARALRKEVDKLGELMQEIVEQLKTPRRAEVDAEKKDRIAKLREQKAKAEDRARASGGAHEHIVEARRLQREIAALVGPEPPEPKGEQDKKTDTSKAGVKFCPIDGLAFQGGRCPVNATHRPAASPLVGLRASRERLAASEPGQNDAIS